jgi:hypothetical protein
VSAETGGSIIIDVVDRLEMRFYNEQRRRAEAEFILAGIERDRAQLEHRAFNKALLGKYKIPDGSTFDLTTGVVESPP